MTSLSPAQTDVAAAAAAADTSMAGVGNILTTGTLVGVALLFVITLTVAHWAGATWGGSAGIASWAALVGGPFFGVMIFFGGRVGALGE